MKLRKRLVFRGTVQGVGFRWRAVHAAQAAGVTGWVRNEADGSVTLELQGTAEQMAWVLEGIGRSPYIAVDAVEVTPLPPAEEERSFRVLD